LDSEKKKKEEKKQGEKEVQENEKVRNKVGKIVPAKSHVT
jgi:hypothetical protein